MAPPDRHVVVDGSNIATEGRSLPSLSQLDKAVSSFISDNPEVRVTVVVDATFAHRIKPKERTAFEAAAEAGEIVVPPAGAVGRGDAFILQVADKADATVLSNDSFQEFHGEHRWLFEPGRLVGAKPVEGIGWIFVDRVPVRGPESRRATQSRSSSARSSSSRGASTKSSKKATKKPTKKAATKESTKSTTKKALPKKAGATGSTLRRPKTPPPRTTVKATPDEKRPKGDGRSTKKPDRKPDKQSSTKQTGDKKSRNHAPSDHQRRGQEDKSSPSDRQANSQAEFLGFVTRHSIGDTVVGIVDQFSSHGCYLQIASARCYLPSKAMGDPPPSRARDVVSVGQNVKVRVESLDAERRGINLELVKVLDAAGNKGGRRTSSSRRDKGNQKKSSQDQAVVADGSAREANLTRSKTIVAKSTKKPAKKAAAKKSTKKAARKPVKKVTKRAAKATPSARAAKATKKTAPKKATAKKATKKATAKKAVAKKATKKTAPKKATAKKATKKATAKKATAKKATKKATAKKATAKKSTKKATAKKAVAKKSTKKTAPKKATAKKATKKATAKKAVAKKSTKKATAKKATAKKATAKKSTKKTAPKKATAKKATRRR